MTKQDVAEWLEENEWTSMNGVACRALMTPVKVRYVGTIPWQELFDEWQSNYVEIPTPVNPILTWVGVIQWIKATDEVELRIQDTAGHWGCVWASEIEPI